MNKNIQKYSEYNLNQYIEDIKEIGLEKTWNEICEYVLKKEDLAKALVVLAKALEAYPGRIL